ncbi:murein biosynthesis integral membrane protein MurJ [Selenomonas ruminantium]|uniref:murein biosynthesis integral membrane protein MurJ n=1 Tax=Selenomonas ruminantium TaxID=971 RepID=UPI001569413D|nr:murein biosynthesis integral membrane protein MurJ [Selenomonas ruminantium]
MRVVIFVICSNIFFKVFGFWREVLVAQFYGTGPVTDAYVIANSIPTVFIQALGTALAATFIPVFAQVEKDVGKKRAERFTCNLVVLVFILCLALVVLGEMFSGQLVRLFAPGFVGETLALTDEFVRILLPCLIFMSVMNILGAYLQYHQQFRVIGIVPAVGNLVIIISLFMAHYIGNPAFFVWGTLFGICSQVLFYVYSIRINKLWHISLNPVFIMLKDKYVISLLPLLLPVFLGSAVNEINTIVGKSLASSFDSGSVAALDYAGKLIMMISSVILGGLTAVFFPSLSKTAISKDIREFSALSMKLNSVVVLVLLPIMAETIYFSREIVSLIFKRGAFAGEAVELTASILIFFALGLVGMGVREILTKMFYAMQDTKTPMKNGVVCALLNIFLSVLLVQYMGVCGLGLATSLAAIFAAINLWRKAVGLGWLAYNGQEFGKVILATVIMILGQNFLSISADSSIFSLILTLLHAVCIGGFLYAISLYGLKHSIALSLVEKLKRKWGNMV